MPKVGLIESCEKYFATKVLYDVLGVEPTANDAELKKAYYKTSLDVHPDRVIESRRKVATEKFQILGQVYSILSDKDKRAIYDETGDVDDDEDDDHEPPNGWSEYWRLLFKKITVDDIDQFKKDYQGSSEEIDDLKEIYERNKGNMNKIMESMFFADGENEDRLRTILLDLIDKNEVKKYNVFVNEPQKQKENRRKKQLKEKKEAEKQLLEVAGKSSPSSQGSSLVEKIRGNNKNRFESVLDNLEKKYGGKNERKKRARDSSQSDEDDDDKDDDESDDEKEPEKKKKTATVTKKTTKSKAETKAPKTTARKSMRGGFVKSKRAKGGRK